MLDYDSELRHQNDAFRQLISVESRDRVLDIGCGTGQTTRDAARIATDGRVLGIDTAEKSLQTARQLTRSAGFHNVEYIRGDAALLPFPPGSIDIAISRFGTMFFRNPVAAFTDIRGTLRAGGRLVMMVWQAAQQNAWAVAIQRALVRDDNALPASDAGQPAFSLGEQHTVRRILHSAYFVDVTFTDVRNPVYYGPDVECAFQFVSQFANVTSAMESQTENERERTNARLRDTMAHHLTQDGVLFESRAWIVTARGG